MEDVQRAAQDWLSQDPDPETRSELEALLRDSNREEELAERFSSVLSFGTAGLRGVLGAGPARMNRVLVQRVSAGLADYLKATSPSATEEGVVIGYDARVKSRVFAEDTARIFLGAGFRVYLSNAIVPTPVVSFGVTTYGAAAGVMITASHNPPEYNGYKVYWGNGAQIIPPHDEGIAKAFAQVPHLDGVKKGELEIARKSGQLVEMGEDLFHQYIDGVIGLGVHKDVLYNTPLTVAYTPLHGVGTRFVRDVFHKAGVSALHVEPSQEQPDGTFPTVAFPNPEEAGAMDRVTALGCKVSADIVVANDPDADRLAISIPDGSGGFSMLTGDQVGILLADYLLREGHWETPLVATTIVSSQLLGILAKDLGVQYRMTLTGFKWIANTALATAGAHLVMGYEEALGYCVGELARDKDGVSAALLMCELAAFAKANGSSLTERLEEIYRRYGVFLTKQVSTVLPGAEGKRKIEQMMRAFRTSTPDKIGAYPVVEHYDLAEGVLDLPKSNVIVFLLEGNRRVIMRPSGTEPKLKCYYEVCTPIAESEAVVSALARAKEEVAALCSAHQDMFA